MSLIVDGADYFRALRAGLLQARQAALMIGWDFDFDIEMLPGESDADGNAPDGLPNAVGPFLNALVARCPSLDIYLLKWSGGAVLAPASMWPVLKLNMMGGDQIHLALDGSHPIGACHHQKIVVIDDSLAFCGGIDVTSGRWDTPDHLPNDPRRADKSGENICPPWHDATSMVSGPAAAALGDLARDRWKRSQNTPLPEPVTPRSGLWAEGTAPDFEAIPVAIARTEPPGRNSPIVAEIERLYIDAINGAQRFLYIESQYFSAGSIADAIASRLSEADGPEVVIVNPLEAHNAVEDAAMHGRRGKLLAQLQAVDHQGRLRMVYPADTTGAPIYVHAKLMIADDVMLRVGSSNLDRRSMGFDTEADIAVIAESKAERAGVAAVLHRLLAEHLGTSAEAVARTMDNTGSLLATLDRLGRAEKRGLRVLIPKPRSWWQDMLADSKLFDPRFRQSAQNRLGVTSRHAFIGLGLLGAVGTIALVRRHRRKR
ncbi:phospholipase D-like domain-containing protein [Paracoccus suum]|nr:phospholipase D-like domain-containing protein [Paracoccus suum]